MRHFVSEKLKCSECSYAAFSPANLAVHKRKHTGEKPFSCTECSYSAATKRQIKTHMRTHTGEKPYKCTYCKKGFSQAGGLQRHVRHHTGEKPFKCKACDYASGGQGDVQNHQLLHSSRDWSRRCQYVAHYFVLAIVCMYFTPSLTADKLKCSDCDYMCYGNYGMTKHSRIHTGERPYKCTNCNYAASIPHNLRIHVRDVHGDDKVNKGIQIRFSKQNEFQINSYVSIVITRHITNIR